MILLLKLYLHEAMKCYSLVLSLLKFTVEGLSLGPALGISELNPEQAFFNFSVYLISDDSTKCYSFPRLQKEDLTKNVR